MTNCRFRDAGDCGITIYDVSLADNGNWQCQVTAVVVGQQTLQSDTINLLVLISPERPNIRRTVSLCSHSHGRGARLRRWGVDQALHSEPRVLPNCLTASLHSGAASPREPGQSDRVYGRQWKPGAQNILAP